MASGVLAWENPAGLRRMLPVAVFAFLGLLGAWATFVHVDDTDADLYRTVVRNLATDGAWLNLRYLPSAYPEFREHLPFGFWPYALAQRAGEQGPVVLAWGVSMGTLALLARRNLLAAFFLGTVASFFELAATVRLDHVLVLATTGAGLALLDDAEVGPTDPKTRWRPWLFAAGCTAVAVAVKGPFGLVPVAAIVLSRAMLERRVEPLMLGIGVGLVSLAGPALFLLDAWREGNSWYSGYLVNQLAASAVGARVDETTALEPWRAVAERFWPWLPIALWALYQTARHRALRLQGLSLVLMLLALGVPGRRVWNHALIAFPFLALWLAESLNLARLRSLAGAATWTVAAATSVGLAAVALGVPGRWRTCVVPREAVEFSRTHPPQSLAVVRPPDDGQWKVLAVLAGEYGAVPRLVDSLEEASARDALAVLTIGEAPGWTCTAATTWRFCARRSETRADDPR